MPKTAKRAGTPALRLEVRPVTPDRWSDVEALFGAKGACAGCWCTWWRQKRSDYEAGRGEGNRALLRSIVERGDVPGLLAYDADAPVGWIALASREAYPRLARSRVLAPVDDEPVWSVPCFFVAKTHRRLGVAGALLAAAVEHARERGARFLEAYPVDGEGDDAPAVFVFTGLPSTFEKAGFREVARRSPTRPVYRLALAPAKKRARSPG